ncbi:phosphatase PAP2 family protein [Terriglobus saanensis]|uniref:Phosphoesterase PA-phosphatase related protein n=1 Tax=Terriglobus saanensis (strain ATCC BAA-1853 / DSM 23119 / SP1PR4) TaxID=401053 RepID=E8V1T7_TERSS|nr:phosphatase PAP2 family protein [Terriglobus saanensis]ADV83425.1 phosphoesterase PA-phosphatase related protein [Terriglobus saanensis SP1PR4]
MSQVNTDVTLSSTYRARIDDLFLRMNQREVHVVAKLVRYSEPKPLLLTVNAINQLCDGWIYLPIALYVVVLREWRLLVALITGVALSHLFYGSTKPRFARVRPCNFVENIPSRSRCLDRYSFPSGHCMTLSVVGFLLCWQHHAAIPALALGLLLLCWARVASGQHYPSDLVAGIGVGYFVGTTVALILL